MKREREENGHEGEQRSMGARRPRQRLLASDAMVAAIDTRRPHGINTRSNLARSAAGEALGRVPGVAAGARPG